MIFKVPSAHPGYLRKVYPGFLQHAGFVAMNPDRHLNSHWDYYLDLVKGDMDDVDGHRKFYDEYNAVMDLPAEYYLDTIKVVFQEHRLPNGTWDVRGKPVRPQDIRERGAVHDRRRTRRHLGQRPDPGRARPLHEHPEGQAEAPDRRRRRPLRHLQRPSLARADRAADPRLHPRQRLIPDAAARRPSAIIAPRPVSSPGAA